MTLYNIALYAHVIGACVLLGTGAGIAFFMLISNRSRDPALVAHVAGIVVLADWLFTATAAIAQPISGVILANLAGWQLLQGWLLISILLYVLVGAFWLPVIWIQLRIHKMAKTARDSGTALPDGFALLNRIWIACGFPAFAAVLAILWLMLTKPG